MTNLSGVVKRLKKEQARLSKQMVAIGAALSAFGASYAKGPARKMTSAGKAKIASAQRKRWAKFRAAGGKAKGVAISKKRTMFAGARKRIAAAQRARWAKVKAAKKSA